MELNAEQIKKALECCAKIGCGGLLSVECDECPYSVGSEDCKNLEQDALSLIKKLTEEVEGLKQCLEHEHASFMETFGEWNDKCEKLTEENANLHASCTELEQTCKKWQSRLDIECKYTKADTVRKMQSEIKERCIKGGIYPAFVASTIDQIAKEMLESANE